MGQFAEVVQEQLELQDMSVSELSRRAGVARPYLHRIIAGIQTPTIERAERIANALGFTLEISEKPG